MRAKAFYITKTNFKLHFGLTDALTCNESANNNFRLSDSLKPRPDKSANMACVNASLPSCLLKYSTLRNVAIIQGEGYRQEI